VPSYTVGVAAATAVVGYDMFVGEPWARSPVNRTINEIGVAGSAVVGDSEVELLVDEVRIGNFFNAGLLLPTFDQMIALGRLFIPSGALLRCLVRDAPATSLLYIRVDLQQVR